MLFSSFTFLCFFLPIVLFIYYFIPMRLRNSFLLAASLFFYAWGEPKYIFYMLTIISLVYVSALAFSWYETIWAKKLLLASTILAVLSILFFFKYFNFTILTINQLIGGDLPLLSIIMPIGISFYTFQALSYLIDVSRGGASAQKNFFHLALYISLFPQLIAGPIVRYETICGQLIHRRHSVLKIYKGFQRFIIGLSKKVIIANTLGVTVDRIFGMPIESLSSLVVWTGIVFYALQLYFDFSGYSDMAIGLGRMFGFKFLENFNYPYLSRSLTEFWRRWHISLSTWFKEYVYIPLGGNRRSLLRTCFNLALVFLLTGIWHGAAWVFIIWGLWHGFFIILEKCIPIRVFSFLPHPILTLLGHFYALFIILVGWVFFRSENLTFAFQYLQLMTYSVSSDESYGISYFVQPGGWVIALIAVFAAFGGGRWILTPHRGGIEILVDIYLWCLLFFTIVLLTASSYNPFIYFRF